ncbi:hypothetical protein CJ030_MR7G017411 [Morella rubra]|uniref:PGG domain-containing protein n=1 Tax=Morella rubra TaxID=262757 RepID=A0A6A1V5A8_9ROSI|nr:hypothetical protein CJ030_MR7G017411 [Morella rubra]
MSSLSNLLNEKDVDGNTPLHHEFMSKYITIPSYITLESIRWPSTGQNLNAFDAAVNYLENDAAFIFSSTQDDYCSSLPQRILEEEDEIKEHVKEREKKREERLQKESGSDLVMATLITTVTFAAAGVLNLVAMVAMVLSFVTGIYAVLAHSLDLVIPSLIIGLSFFAILFLILYKKLKDSNF